MALHRPSFPLAKAFQPRFHEAAAVLRHKKLLLRGQQHGRIRVQPVAAVRGLDGKLCRRIARHPAAAADHHRARGQRVNFNQLFRFLRFFIQLFQQRNLLAQAVGAGSRFAIAIQNRNDLFFLHFDIFSFRTSRFAIIISAVPPFVNAFRDIFALYFHIRT